LPKGYKKNTGQAVFSWHEAIFAHFIDFCNQQQNSCQNGFWLSLAGTDQDNQGFIFIIGTENVRHINLQYRLSHKEAVAV
jgi:hypothetical protein